MTRTHVVRQHRMLLKARPEKVFPLLCPVREYEWIEPWSCSMVYSSSGVAELDCVFQTTFPDDGPPDTWVISRHEVPARIEFVRINARRAMRYEIALAPAGENETRADWTQVITALDEEGDRLVGAITETGYAAEMETLERLLNHFLATGERLAFVPPPRG